MSRFKTKMMPVGEFTSPQGKVVVTPERQKHWVDSFKKMKNESGINIPVPWGHNLAAMPSKKDAAFMKSKYNSGYLEDMNLSSDGFIEFDFDIAGVELKDGKLISTGTLPDGITVQNAIKEISPSIAGAFLDGSGKIWEDVITHVALTPLPVVANQEGFSPVGATENTIALSLDAVWMATEDPKTEELEEEDDEEEEEPEEEKIPPKEHGAGSSLPKDLLNDLAALDIRLPEDTNCDNLAERLAVVAKALVHKAGGTPAGTSDVREEQPQGMMLALEALPAEQQQYLKTILAENKDIKDKARVRRFKKIQKRFEATGLPVEAKAKHFSLLTQTNLSLEGITDEELDALDHDLELVETCQKTINAKELSTQLTNATDHPNPLEGAAQGKSKHAQDVVRMARGNLPEKK